MMENSYVRLNNLIKKKKCESWLVVLALLSIGLFGCIADSAVTPQLATIKTTSNPTSTSSVPVPNERCKSLAPSGLPGDANLRKSHILYYAINKTHNYPGDQIWATSMADGSDKLLVDKLSASRGIGFLPDGVHFITIGPMISDINGSLLKEINPFDYADFFPRYSPMWDLLTNDPEVTHNQYDTVGGYFSSYSPDRKHIAIWHISIEKPDINNALPLIIQDKESGDKVVVLRTKPNERIAGSWSPDGKNFLFTLDPTVYVFDVEKSELLSLTEVAKHEWLERPRWSPDGKKAVILVWNKFGGMDMMIINFLTGKTVRYPISRSVPTTSPMEQGESVWSPDSNWFAYISDSYHYGLEILNVENGDIYCGRDDKSIGILMMDWK